MSTTNTTSSMSLVLPNVGQQLGPTYATNINAALTRIDSHSHLTGYGVPIVTAALNINADLSFANGIAPVNAISLRSVRFATQPSVLVSPDLACAYSVGTDGDLYWNDLNGNQIQLTANGQIAISGSRGITGLVAPASATYAPDTFTWLSDTGPNAALMDQGPTTIRDVADGANGITIKSPTSLATSYNITLPAVLPASSLPLFLGPSTAGQLIAQQITTAAIADGAITAAKNAAVTIQGGGVIATYSTTATTLMPTTITTPLTVTTLRPIILSLRAVEGQTGPASVSVNSTETGGTAQCAGFLAFAVTGPESTTVGSTQFSDVLVDVAPGFQITSTIPASSMQCTFIPTALGTFTFTLQACTLAGATLTIVGTQLLAYQL